MYTFNPDNLTPAVKKYMHKLVDHFIGTIDSDILLRAVYNHHIDRPNLKGDSLGTIDFRAWISRAFTWGRTPEGSVYWLDIKNSSRASTKTPLPPPEFYLAMCDTFKGKLKDHTHDLPPDEAEVKAEETSFDLDQLETDLYEFVKDEYHEVIPHIIDKLEGVINDRK